MDPRTEIQGGAPEEGDRVIQTRDLAKASLSSTLTPLHDAESFRQMEDCTEYVTEPIAS